MRADNPPIANGPSSWSRWLRHPYQACRTARPCGEQPEHRAGVRWHAQQQRPGAGPTGGGGCPDYDRPRPRHRPPQRAGRGAVADADVQRLAVAPGAVGLGPELGEVAQGRPPPHPGLRPRPVVQGLGHLVAGRPVVGDQADQLVVAARRDQHVDLQVDPLRQYQPRVANLGRHRPHRHRREHVCSVRVVPLPLGEQLGHQHQERHARLCRRHVQGVAVRPPVVVGEPAGDRVEHRVDPVEHHRRRCVRCVGPAAQQPGQRWTVGAACQQLTRGGHPVLQHRIQRREPRRHPRRPGQRRPPRRALTSGQLGGVGATVADQRRDSGQRWSTGAGAGAAEHVAAQEPPDGGDVFGCSAHAAVEEDRCAVVVDDVEQV